MSTIAAHRSLSTARPVAQRPSPRSAPSPVQGSVRLTGRGRAVLLMVFVVLAYCLFSAFGGESAATGEAGEPVDTRIVMVGDGDTLWGIASEVAEPGEIREMIHQIQELNALPDASLAQGQRIAVPIG